MRLLLIHGRFDREQDMDDWGFDGMPLDGVEALHVTYMTSHVLWFEDAASANKAHALTGWPYFDENALEMQFHDDLLKTTCISADGPAMYFGDWELQIPTG
jgi:hypothetical protein